jgi:hypothetical protein
MTEKTVNKAPSGRPKRQPVGHRNRLTVADKDPNYVYRWVNANADGGDRPAILAESGYEFVPKSQARKANVRVSDAGPLGTYETTPGGSGDTLVLMRQKREYYDEDQVAKQARVDKTEAAQKKRPDDFYGKVQHSTERIKHTETD